MERIIGREREIREVLDNIGKGRHTLLVGDVGCGKSAILREAYRRLEEEGRIRIIYIAGAPTLKDILLEVMRQLHQKYKVLKIVDGGGKLEAGGWKKNNSPHLSSPPQRGEEGGRGGRLEVVNRRSDKNRDAKYKMRDGGWEELRRTLERMKVKEMMSSILNCLEKGDYILILDHLEKVTPTVKGAIELLMDKACVASSIVPELMKKSVDMKRLYWRFHRLRIRNLGKEKASELIDWLCSELGIVVEDEGMLKNRLLRASRGNPLMIKEILSSGALEGLMTKDAIRQIDLIEHAGTRYIDHTPVLLIAGAVVMMARYASLGLADRTMYVLAGAGMALFMVVRFFVYRGMRR